MLNRTIDLYRGAFEGLTREMWLLSLVTFINRAGTMVIPFMSVYLTQELNFSKGNTGVVLACFGLGSILGTLSGGRLSDRYGFYPVMFWSLFSSGFMFILLQFMHSLPAVCVTIFFLGLIGEAFRPANTSSVASYSTPETRTRSISLLRLAVNIGFSIGPAIGGLLAHSLGYKWLFIADGITCITAALFFRFMLKPVKSVPQKAEFGEKPVKASSPFRDMPYMAFALMITLWAFAFMQFFSAIPVFYKEHYHLNEGQIGAFLAFNGLLIALFEMPFVYKIEGRIRQMTLIKWGAIAVGASYLIYLLPGSWFWVVTFSVVVITIGEMLSMPFASTYAMNRATDQNRGQYMAVYSLTYSIAHVLAPMVGLYVAGHFGYHTLWVMVAVLCLMSFAGLALIDRPAKNTSTLSAVEP